MKTRMEYTCPLELTHDVTKGKWKPIILWQLGKGRRSLSSLKKEILGITQKMLMSNGIYKSLIAHNLLLLPFLLYVRMNHIFDQQAQTHTYSLSIPCEYSSSFVCVFGQINSISYIKVGMDCLVHHTLSFYTL